MRVTQIMLQENFGGVERSFVDTSLGLAARGHQVQAICRPDFVKKYLLEGVPGVRVDTASTRGKYGFTGRLQILRVLRSFRSEIVHTQMQRAANHGGWASRMLGIPVISKLHNYVMLGPYARTHTLIGTTDEQRRHALSQGWPTVRLTVIPNFSRVPAAAKSRTPGAGQLQLLAYGRYIHKKGFDVLIRAFKQLVDAGVDAHLTIYGNGREADSLAALSQELGVKDRIQIGVWLDDIAGALDEADVFVLPSRDEPFGIVMLEAMARGLPIVTTRTQGPLVVLRDETAYFADVDSVDSLGAALLDVARDRVQAGQKASAALELYRTTYHEDAVLPRFEALYKSVTAGSG